MWKPWTWATASHEQAIVNARRATTACSRRRVERNEVEQYLAGRRPAWPLTIPPDAPSGRDRLRG